VRPYTFQRPATTSCSSTTHPGVTTHTRHTRHTHARTTTHTHAPPRAHTHAHSIKGKTVSSMAGSRPVPQEQRNARSWPRGEGVVAPTSLEKPVAYVVGYLALVARDRLNVDEGAS
jgi:hypothetical protein